MERRSCWFKTEGAQIEFAEEQISREKKEKARRRMTIYKREEFRQYYRDNKREEE